jgi:putative ABC transport system permease protein
VFLNYLKTAFRSLFRNRMNSTLNVLGLAIATACCLLISLYLVDQWSVNRNFTNSDQLCRIISMSTNSNGEINYWDTVTPLLNDELRNHIPQVEAVASIRDDEAPVKSGDQFFTEKYIGAEPGIIDFFDIEIIDGNLIDPIKDYNSVIVNEYMVDKYFDGKSPINEILTLLYSGEEHNFIVTGVYKNSSAKSGYSEIGYNFIIPFEWNRIQILKNYGETWGLCYSQTLIKLTEGSQIEEVETAIQDHIKALFVDSEENSGLSAVLQPFSESYLTLSNPRDLPVINSPTSSFILFSIGIVILTIACINFTTLSIGRATYRSREIGVRKVMGANRGHIIRQFWMETLILTLFSLIMGIILSALLLPHFNYLTDASLQLSFDPTLIVSLLILTTVIVIFAGAYPAFFMSKFSAVQAFKGEVKTGGKNRLRHTLVFIQFSISIAFIAMTIIMGHQMQFIFNQNLGMDGDQVIEISVDIRDDTGAITTGILREELKNNPNVLSVAGSANGFNDYWMRAGWADQSDPNQKWERIYFNTVSYDFLKTLGIGLADGRSFSREFQGDEDRSLVVNEAFVKYMGWENAIGKELPGGGFADNVIIGVVKDFNYASLHEEIKPLILSMNPFIIIKRGVYCSIPTWVTVQKVLVKIAPGDIQQTIKEVETAWNSVIPDKQFDFTFIDDSIEKKYQNDRRWNSVVQSSSIMAIVIATLGLFGLSTLEVSHRTKEIGVRKVLGASTKNLIVLLSKQITILVIVSNLVAWPTAWYLMSKWLENFAYKASISPLSMGIAGVSALLVAWFTVGFLSWRAANTNPVKTLRSE